MKKHIALQVDSIKNKNWITIIKMIIAVICLKNRLIFINCFYPLQYKYHALIGVIFPNVNLGCFGICIGKWFYFDISKLNPFDTFLYNDICFFFRYKIYARYHTKRFYLNLSKRHKFINSQGFISWHMISALSGLIINLLLALTLGLAFSLSDIDFPSYQGFLNDIQYLLNILHK